MGMLETSREAVRRLFAAIETDFHVPYRRIVLGGFSQGAAVAMDSALHMLPLIPAAIGFFSGSLMCRRRWRSCFEAAGEDARDMWRQLRLLQAHGKWDMKLGVNGGRWLHTFCVDDLHMHQTEYIEFKGGHTIPSEVVDMFVDLVIAACDDQSDS